MVHLFFLFKKSSGGQLATEALSFFCCCLTLLYLSQEQPGLGRTKLPMVRRPDQR